MAYANDRRGLAGIITDWSQVTDAGLARAETFLTPAQLSLVTGIASQPRIVGPDTRATQDGLLNGQQPGGALWVLVHESIGVPTGQARPGSISFADAIRRYPQLTGLFVAYELWGVTQGAPPDVQVRYASADAKMTLATVRASQQGNFSTSVALPDDITVAEAQPYLEWVAHYLNLLFSEMPQAIAGERDALVYMVLSYARQAAMARGSVMLGNGVEVARELIHYQVECPDGTMYVVMDDVTGDPANRYVYQWLGPNYKPQAFGPGGGFFERDGVTYCTNIIKGTGNWYTARVFGQIRAGDSCDATPDNFTGPWDLITPDISAALTYQSGDPVRVVPPADQVTTIPAITGGGGGGVTPEVVLVTNRDPQPILLAPAPVPVVSSDPLIQLVDEVPTSLPVTVHDTVTGAVVVAAERPVSPWLLLGGVGLLVYLGSRRGR